MAIGWNELLPNDSDFYAGDASAVRSLETSFAQGISNALMWPGSGSGSSASAGWPQFGFGSRPCLDVQSNLSSTVSASLMLSLDSAFTSSSTFTMRLWDTSSVTTQMVGGRLAVEHYWLQDGTFSLVTEAGPPKGTRWVMSGGTVSASSAAVFGVTYGAPPRVWGTGQASTFPGGMEESAVSLSGITTGGCYTNIVYWNGSSENLLVGVVHWLSLGTVAF